jgi:TolA-binding protein
MHEYDLEEIKREIVEGRSLTIKSNNLINALSADLKSIAKRQQGYERRIFVHSVAAYLTTIVVILTLTNIAMDAQVDAVRAEGKDNTEALKELKSELELVQGRERKRAEASTEAARLYQLLASDSRREFLTELPKVATLDLSPTERAVFESAGRKARQELSRFAYQTGIEHARAGRYHEATQSLRESIDLEKDAPHSPQATFELASAYRSLDQQKNAIFILMQLTVASANVDVLDEATFLLAECQIDISLYNDAKETLRTFIRRFPGSPLRNDARQKLAELNLKH